MVLLNDLEFGNVIVDLGRTEAIIQKNEMIPRENIKAGDRIKAYCYDVRREAERTTNIFIKSTSKVYGKTFCSRSS